jgi:hypothetical protein
MLRVTDKCDTATRAAVRTVTDDTDKVLTTLMDFIAGDGHAALIVSKWMTDAETGGELPADDVTTSATLVDDDNSAAVADDDEEEMSEDALLLDKRGLSTWLLATTLRKCRNKPNDCQRLHTRARSLPLQRRHFYRYFFKNIVFQ